MFAQLHSAIFTAFFTDPLSAGMVYKRVGASWWNTSNFNLIVSIFILAPATVFSSVAALVKLSTGFGPPTLIAPVALLMIRG
jgi:hypothetical protein